MDHINVSYIADQKVTDIFEKYGENIKTEVLAEAIHTGTLTGYQKEWSINGEKVSLAVEKR
jgi:isoleucyl-tRNA synthetase